MLDGPERVAVVDVREGDFGEHGHIRGALNVPAEDLEDDEVLEELITRLLAEGAAYVVFHCALSQYRGPTAARRFRNRAISFEEEGGMAQPAVFVLDGGFERFRATPSCRSWVVAPLNAEGHVDADKVNLNDDSSASAVDVPEWAAMLIFKMGPRGVPQPWVKTVVRKAYRSHGAAREQLGYAVVAFRDAEEAELVLAAMDGLHVSAAAVYGEDSVPEEVIGDDARPEGGCFTLRVRRCENGDTAAAGATAAGAAAAKRGPGLDPPLAEQLRPLTTLALQRRVQLLQALGGGDASTVAGNTKFRKPFVLGGPKGGGGAKATALARAVAAYTERPRTERRLEGRAVPTPLAASLLAELQSLRWPAKNERAGLTSERYLVLPTNSAADFYGPLRALCAELMAFAEPSFYYSSIAVTKNFVASPHIDERDRTFQFALSLGDFEGGELCVDEEDCEAEGSAGREVAASCGEHVVAVVNTRNRMAKVDGRHIHWVRSFTGGDRYSLIFFDTSDRAPTPVGRACVDAAWKPHGFE